MILAISILITVISSLYGIYFAVVFILGYCKKRKTFPPAKPQKKIACLIPARNEEAVIAYLVDSLQKQDYPKDLYQIIVLANGCTDRTEEVAKEAGARLLPLQGKYHSKGEVLHDAFEALEKEDFDAYVILDADNVVIEHYLSYINDALCAGYKAGQTKREGKNPFDAWPSLATTIFYRFMNDTINSPRSRLGMAAPFNGTGVVICKELISQYDYHMTTLTEDLELTAQYSMEGIKIAYIEDAITYDEQPVTLKDSIEQRKRWGAGVVQVQRKYNRKLLQKRHLQAFDFFMQANGSTILLLGCISFALGLLHFCVTKNLLMVLLSLLGYVVSMFFSGIGFLFLGTIISRTFNRKLFPMGLMMGLFLITATYTNVIAFFKKPPKWEHINHNHCASIAQVKSNT